MKQCIHGNAPTLEGEMEDPRYQSIEMRNIGGKNRVLDRSHIGWTVCVEGMLRPGQD